MEVAFHKGDYVIELENATVTIHVPRDVTVDEVLGEEDDDGEKSDAA